MLAGLGGLAVLLGLVGDSDETEAAQEGVRLAADYGLGVLVPVTALLFASAALGEPANDGSLVYLWLRPISRLHIVLGSVLGSLTLALPVVLVPLVVAVAVAGGSGGLLAATVLATSLGMVAYCGLFVLLGLVVSRALLWGLLYILIWEGFIAAAGTGAAFLAVRAHTRSLVVQLSDAELSLAEFPLGVSVVWLVAVGSVSIWLSTLRLERMDIP